MSELAKRCRAMVTGNEQYTMAEWQDTLLKAADLIEKQEADINRLQPLAVCSSEEGTSFYYKDDWEARGKNIEKLERLLGLYRQMCDYFARHEEEIDCIQMTKLLEKIKQEETL